MGDKIINFLFLLQEYFNGIKIQKKVFSTVLLALEVQFFTLHVHDKTIRSKCGWYLLKVTDIILTSFLVGYPFAT